jgi:hypothetical protein
MIYRFIRYQNRKVYLKNIKGKVKGRYVSIQDVLDYYIKYGEDNVKVYHRNVDGPDITNRVILEAIHQLGYHLPEMAAYIYKAFEAARGAMGEVAFRDAQRKVRYNIRAGFTQRKRLSIDDQVRQAGFLPVGNQTIG